MPTVGCLPSKLPTKAGDIKSARMGATCQRDLLGYRGGGRLHVPELSARTAFCQDT